ncbi:phage major tail tube protein [Comamonas thiooxydans]|uniref:Phage major tail tube protein n=1 Tax=Comamonas thiooxydans TaxID=363952 RepID=A0AA42TWZ4_9BURK|nr:phage major tail tube protein [Comamonas thiooxydans]MDH1337605.1 phage major tail tube protein [Comamonas thiooxydans]MDH1743805.1 phage major tail tube protein [Comamonas thiooxydans]MDH1790104.1 phage major tail tube protein [Comamonas thiooxydans]
MSLPSKLKNFNLFGDGNVWRALIDSVTVPKLTRKVEEWRGGGMHGPIEVDLGHEKLEMSFKAGGFLLDGYRAFGGKTHNANQWRFAGAYEDDGTAVVTAVEILVSGRVREIDPGDAKAGDDTEHTHTISVSYYKLTVDGRDVIEIDMPGLVFNVDGQDVLSKIRRAIGM